MCIRDSTKKKQILCKFIKKDETCPKGRACEFSHMKRFFDKNGKYIPKPKAKSQGRGGGQSSEAQVNSLEEWNTPPVGLNGWNGAPQVLVTKGLGKDHAPSC